MATVLVLASHRAGAQEHHHEMPATPQTPPEAGTQTEHEAAMGAEMTGPLGLPIARDGSGTSWQPEAHHLREIVWHGA